ncbi:MAG: GNAT family N-acetyltransferase [Spirochaetaceae bacterium]|nr:GNAT family N-acetyltransferase [Myxococcales bacterium]MCB9723686.1 GNAT family N-acetyltransferase [Spirochaetaceae bacterium]
MSDPASKVEFSLEDGVAGLPRDEWDALVGDDSPFLEWAFLSSLEDSGTLAPSSGWTPRPLVARHAGQLVAACPLYLKTNSEGEFVFDHAWADAAYRAGIDYFPKLLVGVPFSPVGGRRFLVHPELDRPAWIRQLGGALREIGRSNGLSSVHVNFCRPDEADALASLDFHTRIGLQYHWHNRGYSTFEDYLGDFRSKRRNQVRRERRALDEQDVRIVTRTGDSLGPEHVETMFRFYISTIRARAWGRQYLNRDTFTHLVERFRERLVFIVAEQAGEPVAGTINVQKGDALYGRYWGATRELRHLHFNVCYYAAVEHCIRHGLARFEPGAGGEYKQVRGFDASPTWSAHWIAEPRLAAAIEQYLARERAEAEDTIDWYREHSALKSAADDESDPTRETTGPRAD